LYRADEAIPESGYSFYIAWPIRRIAERLTQLINGSVEAMVKVTCTHSGPETVAKIFPTHNVARPIQQGAQNLPGLGWKF